MNLQEYIESGILEQFVLGQLSEAELAEVRTMAETHPEIQAELDTLETTIFQLSQSDAQPGFTLDMEALKKEVAQQPSTQTSTNTIPKLIKLRRLSTIAAAIALFAVGACAFLLSSNQKLKQEVSSLESKQQQLVNDFVSQQNDYNALVATIGDPITKRITLSTTGSPQEGKDYQATVYWKASTETVYLYTNNLPEPPTGKQYQLWTLVDGKPIDAGVMPIGQLLAQLKNVSASDVFAITLENEGGAIAPDLEQLYVLGTVS